MKSDVAERASDPKGDHAVDELKKLLKEGDLKKVRSLLPSEMALLFRVSVRTLAVWGYTGKIPSEAYFRTPGFHKRYYEAYVHKMLAQSGMEDENVRQQCIDAARAGVVPHGDPVMNTTSMPHRFR